MTSWIFSINKLGSNDATPDLRGDLRAETSIGCAYLRKSYSSIKIVLHSRIMNQGMTCLRDNYSDRRNMSHQ